MKIVPNFHKPNPKNLIVDAEYLYKFRKGSKRYTHMQMVCILQGWKGFGIYYIYRFIIFKSSRILEISATTFNRAIKEGRVKILS